MTTEQDWTDEPSVDGHYWLKQTAKDPTVVLVFPRDGERRVIGFWDEHSTRYTPGMGFRWKLIPTPHHSEGP